MTEQYIPSHQIMRVMKVCFVALMSLMIVFANLPMNVYSLSHYSGKVYYVSTDGNDEGEGTLTSPWRTIQKAADTMIAGETVLVRGGVYEEFIRITSSGNARDGYITFQAYPGEVPVIDGSNLRISGSNSSLVQLRNANYIVVEGFEIRGLSSESSDEYPAGIKLQYGGSNIHLLNNNVHHIANTSADGNAHGIVVYGNSLVPISDVTISGNQIHHLTLGSSESLTVVGNVNGFRLENNIIHDNNNIGIDIAGYYNTCSGACTDQARNGVIIGNTVYNIDSSTNPAYGSGSKSAGGIYVDGGTEIVIEQNQVYNSNFGIELASEKKGKSTSNVTVRNNFIHHNEGAGLIMGGSSSDNGGAQNNTITNNTFYENDTLRQGYGEITFQHHNERNVIVNNIIYALPSKLFIQKSNKTGSGNLIDYNLYYRADGESGASWRWEGTSHKSWDDFKSATGYDANSLYGDPLFVSAGSGDISLSGKSPAVNSGWAKHGKYGAVDYFGALRESGDRIDRGAAEYGSQSAAAPTPTPASPTPAPTSTPTRPPTTAPPTPTPSPAATLLPSSAPAASAKPAPTAAADEMPIDIDGNAKDWSNAAELSSSSSNVRVLKALATDEQLFVLITGNLLMEKGQLFINTDQNGESGFQAPYWKNSGSEYMIENGRLYRYSGTGGTNWKWTQVSNYSKVSRYAVNSTTIEYAISLADLGVTAADGLRIGYAWKDSNAHKLPFNGAMQLIGKADGASQYPAASDESDNSAAAQSITIDAVGKEWHAIANIASESFMSYKMTNDDSHLYIYIEGSGLTGKLQLYLNTDQNEATGYRTSNWTTAGIDYLVEEGRLYRYTGDGKKFAWKQLSSLKTAKLYSASDSVVELAIPLNEVSISKGSVVQIGLLLDDSKTAKLPLKGDLNKYTLK